MPTKSFKEEKNIVLSGLISALQDLGYLLQYADITTGKVTAKCSSTPTPFLTFLTGLMHIDHTEASAIIHESEGKTHVRLDFLSTQPAPSDENGRKPDFETEIHIHAFELTEYKILELITAKSLTTYHEHDEAPRLRPIK